MKFLCAVACVVAIVFGLVLPIGVFAQDNYKDTIFKHRVDFNTFRNIKGIRISWDAVRNFALFHIPLDFSSSRFKKTADFSYAHFDSTAEFSLADFNSAAKFAFSEFHSSVFFHSSHFHSTVTFSGSRFNEWAGFSYVRFDSTVDFGGARFVTTAEFGGAGFHGRASFDFVHYYSTARFHYADFDSTVFFVNTCFDSAANFDGAHFGKEANFTSTKLNDKFIVTDAVLPDLLNFSYIMDFPHNIDFTYCKLDPIKKQNPNYRCKIALYGSDISKISINMDLFELWFPGPDSSYEQKVSVYEKVLKKLHEDGFTESYQRLDIEYQKLKLEHSGLSALAWFQDIWWRFGYSKERVFMWAGAFLGVFFGLFLWRFRRLYDIYPIDFLHLNTHALRRSAINPFSYAFRYIIHVILYTLIVFFGLKLDLDKFRKNGQQRTAGYYSTLSLLLFCYFVGLFCTAYIVNIIFK